MLVYLSIQNGYKVPVYDADDVENKDPAETSSTSSKASDSDTSRPGKILPNRTQSKSKPPVHPNGIAARPPNNHHTHSYSAKTAAEVISIKNMMKVNIFNKNSSSASSLLPQISKTPSRVRAFHAQTKLYRTPCDADRESRYFNGECESDSDESSDDSEDEETTSDDEP